jgi:hypothetical protein
MDDQFSTADARRQSLQAKLARGIERLDCLTDGDRRFFDCHKHRNYRLRQAGQIEIEPKEITTGARMEPPSGKRWFTIVRQVRPGVRVRLSIALPETTGPDISERECEALFIRVCPKKWRDALAWWTDR